MQFSNTLFLSLSKSIEMGRPLNAILRAAEYLDASDPIFVGLAAKAKSTLESETRYMRSKEVIAEVLKGRRLSSFSVGSQAALLSIKESGNDKKDLNTPITPIHFSTRITRRGESSETSRVERLGSRGIRRFPRVAAVSARTSLLAR